MNAAAITRQSKSNLALAFVSLGRERKRDITIFYAFCRVVDDIADSAELSVTKNECVWRIGAKCFALLFQTNRCSPAMCDN